MKWDIAAGGTGIKLTNNGFTCFLQDSSYIFRSILGDTVNNLIFFSAINIFVKRQ